MDYSSAMILAPFNYNEWKSEIGILLHSKGLYRVYLDLDNEPNVVVEKDKWHNRLDQAYGFLCLSISPDLLFHLDCLTTLNQVWTKLESLFGVQDELRAHKLENELFSLSPSNSILLRFSSPNSSHLFYCSSNVGLRRRKIN